LAETESSGRVSADASENLRSFFAENPDPTLSRPEDIPLNIYITNLALSPSKDYLAWREIYQWCPGNYCLGQHTIKVLQLSNHQIIVDHMTPDYFSGPIWSPDSHFLVYDEITWSLKTKDPTLWILDISKRRPSLLGHGLNPAWSPDGKYLAATYTNNPHSGEPPNELRIISFENSFMEILKHPGWDFIDYPNWSPDGKRLVMTGEKASNENSTPILILDSNTKQVSNLTLNNTIRTFRYPKWSPDGKWIAADYWLKNLQIDGVVLNASTGETVYRLNWSGVWEWSNNLSAILFVSDNSERNIPKIKVIYIPSGKVIDLNLPSQITNYLTSKSHLGTITSITW
jgi:hypothetical protein